MSTFPGLKNWFECFVHNFPLIYGGLGTISSRNGEIDCVEYFRRNPRFVTKWHLCRSSTYFLSSDDWPSISWICTERWMLVMWVAVATRSLSKYGWCVLTGGEAEALSFRLTSLLSTKRQLRLKTTTTHETCFACMCHEQFNLRNFYLFLRNLTIFIEGVIHPPCNDCWNNKNNWQTTHLCSNATWYVGGWMKILLILYSEWDTHKVEWE